MFLIFFLLPLVVALNDTAFYAQAAPTMQLVRLAMLSSVRTSWEQGTAAGALVEFDYPQYSIFGADAISGASGVLPQSVLMFALSAVVRQTSDGRLTQAINDGTDGAALDGASAGPAVLLGQLTQASRKTFWANAAAAQLNFILTQVPRTSTGAISHRVDSKQYWADGVYMGFPFIAYYGAISKNQTLLQLAYDQCRLYRNALLESGPNGPLWGHVYSDDTKTWHDKGLWSSGNAWAAKGMLQVAVTLQKSSFGANMTGQATNLKAWVKEILDGTLHSLTSNSLLPDYISGGATFEDAASSAAIAAVAYRASALWPSQFGANYSTAAAKVRTAVIARIDPQLGLMAPVVNPVSFSAVGTLSTEAQAFGLMLFSAWRDWISATGAA